MNCMKTMLATACAGLLALVAIPGQAQELGPRPVPHFPQLPFRLVNGFFHYPAHYDLSRMISIVQAPDGHFVALNRGPHPVLEFHADGSFAGSWGEGAKLIEGAHAVRFGPDGDLWLVDAAANIIYRFDHEGRTAGILGIDGEPWTYLTHVFEGAARGKTAFYQETDIGWSKDGHIYVSDGYGNSRVAEFDPDGNFVKSWGERGSAPGDFNIPHALLVGDDDTIYVADRQNDRIQSFDTDGHLKHVWYIPGPAWSICLTKGPHQVMFAGSIGKIYKLDITTGKILGQFGRMGRFGETLDSVHSLACPDEKTLYVVDEFSSRLQKWVSP